MPDGNKPADTPADRQAAASGSGGIPFDLRGALTDTRNSVRLSITIEGVPDGARFNRGRNLGDKAWSLWPDQVDGLAYLPREGDSSPVTLTVRLTAVDEAEGTATVIDRFDMAIDIVAGAAQATSPEVKKRLAADAAKWQAVRDRQMAEAEAKDKAEQEQRLAKAQARWKAEEERRLAKAEAKWREEQESRLAARAGRAV